MTCPPGRSDVAGRHPARSARHGIRWRPLRCALALLLGVASPLMAQLDPTLRWRTLRTPHFNVHFSPGLDSLARRSAVYAESAWVQLARELHPPRGPIDMAIADNVDFTNGFATIFPSNRIVIYAQPPVATRELRFYEDWAQLVITHELLHIFHIDRSRGLWRAAQYVVGRNPAFFPNAYLPSWVKEGLAVHYETRLTTAGRLASTDMPMVARTARADGRVPSSRDWSLATTQYPLGNTTYAYGALLMQWLAEHATDSLPMRQFVERTSSWLIPFMVDPAARAAFGRSVPKAFAEWQRDQPAGDGVTALVGWRARTRANWMAEYPRWVDDSTLLVAMQPAQQMPGLYAITLRAGDTARAVPRRIGRRNSLDANVPLADGAVLYAEFDQVGPFSLRSDLWIEQEGVARRLTRGARLSHPDVPADDRSGAARIIAVQSVDGTTRLVRVSPTGDSIAPVTAALPDTQWAEPRWRRDGRGFAAVRITRGGLSAVALFDDEARRVGTINTTRGVVAAPQWVDDSTLLFSSDESGVPQLYRATLPVGGCTAAQPCDLPVGGARTVPITSTISGAFHPSMDRRGRLAALHFRRDGFEVITSEQPATVASAAHRPFYSQRAAAASAPTVDASPSSRYAPWRMLLPTYWTPVVGQSALGGPVLGAASSGSDLIGRHAWSAIVAVPTARPDVEGSFAYRYRGFGQPRVDVSGVQSWDYFDVAVRTPGSSGTDTMAVPAVLRRMSRIGALALTVVQPGVRRGGALTIGASLEQRTFSTDPAPALDALAPVFRTQPLYPALTASGSWSTVQRAGRAISLEDGFSLSASVQRRWREGADVPTGSTRLVGAVRGYKSIPWPGFSRHAVALRVAGAWNDRRASSDVSVGGVSGAQIELLPGVVAGDPTRTFSVRGFEPGAQRGISAAAASLEYRAPLLAFARGLGRTPLFLDRTALSLFTDAGRAWCPVGDRTVVCAGSPVARAWLASVGAELSVLGAVGYDAPVRARVGAAQPVSGGPPRSPRRPVAYVTLGASF